MLARTALFGWIATAFGLVYKLPQIARLRKAATVAGISLTSLYIQASSYVFLIVHGVIIDDWPVIIMGIVSLLQSIVLISLFHYCLKSTDPPKSLEVQLSTPHKDPLCAR